MKSEVENYCEGLAGLDLTEAELAIALLWFLDHWNDNGEATANDLANLMHDCSLRGKVNVTRLRRNLAAHPDVVAGKQRGSFKIKLARKAALTDRYGSLTKRQKPKVDDHVVSTDDFTGTRRYLESLVHQINGTYQYGFFDACAVLMRRLTEMLLIEAFEQSGAATAIKQNNNYLQFGDMIGVAQSGRHIRLARGSAAALDKVKELGDAAAHSRTYITKPHDIDDMKLTFRRVVSELMYLAKITPSRSAA